MTCFLIHDSLLKKLGDKYSRKISDRIRARRNRIRRFISKAVGGVSKLFNPPSFLPDDGERFTHSMNHSDDMGSLPGQLVLDEDGHVGGVVSVDIECAHKFSQVIRDYYRIVHGRNSIDNQGMDLVSSCHFGERYNNAFWNGSQMTYGDGDGELFIGFALDLTVDGHEMTHGVVEKEAGLVYYWQPGALNEHYADVFGAVIDQWYQQIPVDKAAWLVGDKIIGPKFPGKALRSFKDEKAYDGDPQPKHMKQFAWTMQDNGGVHINSGIPNRLFYEYCTKLGGYSYEGPAQLWYATLPTLGAYATFKDFKKKLTKTAVNMYGENSKELRALKESLALVGL